MCILGLRGGAETLPSCTAFPGDAGSSFRWLRDGLSAVRRVTRKGPRKCCIFSKSDALLVTGLLTREKKGEKRREYNASMDMHHFYAKIGQKTRALEAPRERFFVLILAG